VDLRAEERAMSDHDTDRNVECARALGWTAVYETPICGWRRGRPPGSLDHEELPDFARDDSWVLRMMHEYNLSMQCEGDSDGEVMYRVSNDWDNDDTGGEIGFWETTIGASVREWVIAFAAAGGKMR
jgi:hypothetical protein